MILPAGLSVSFIFQFNAPPAAAWAAQIWISYLSHLLGPA
jgi:hypothetical protein